VDIHSLYEEKTCILLNSNFALPFFEYPLYCFISWNPS